MQGYLSWQLSEVEKKLNNAPVVVILGPRQCSKSTLAKAILAVVKDAVYLDLERFSDLNKQRESPRGNCQFLVLGSASPELIKQSSETLAGRIAYLELTFLPVS